MQQPEVDNTSLLLQSRQQGPDFNGSGVTSDGSLQRQMTCSCRLTIAHGAKGPRWQNCMGTARHGRTCDVAFSKPIAACARRELCGHAARARVLHKANARTARRQCVTV